MTQGRAVDIAAESGEQAAPASGQMSAFQMA